MLFFNFDRRQACSNQFDRARGMAKEVLFLLAVLAQLSLALKGTPSFARTWPRRLVVMRPIASDVASPPTAPYATAMIVPTGVGAAVGGYAGDALPAARLLAHVSDLLVTHPNVVNGAMMYWPIPNMLYVEGFALDEFAAGRIALLPVPSTGNRIGLLLDKGMEAELRLRHMHVADAARATLGIRLDRCVVTNSPIGVQTKVSELSGASWGTIINIPTLIEAASHLVSAGCDAIAVVARFPESAADDVEAEQRFAQYRQGDGVDEIAGAEALISHVVSKHLHVPCAHAPAFLPAQSVEAVVAPKACAEETGYTFLPCVLSYLQRAPRLVRPHELPLNSSSPVVSNQHIQAVVVPSNALGGPAVLSFLSLGKLVIAVEENTCAMAFGARELPSRYQSRVIRVRSYAEAAGIIVAHRQGLLLESIGPKVAPLSAHEL